LPRTDFPCHGRIFCVKVKISFTNKILPCEVYFFLGKEKSFSKTGNYPVQGKIFSGK